LKYIIKSRVGGYQNTPNERRDMNEKESLTFLEKAQAAGIEFRASLPGKGTFLLSPAEILAYLSFPEKVMARKCNVSDAVTYLSVAVEKRRETLQYRFQQQRRKI
jgi:hypothetical protein